jgi:serine kinase
VKLADRVSTQKADVSTKGNFGPINKVACKIINKDKASDEFISKFLPRELSIIRYLQHPNIVEAYEIFELGSSIYIFMEYCPKGDLLEHLRASGGMSEATAHHHFGQVVDALKYLHGHGIAHRDLKCENILMHENNTVKLSDFGFARCCTTADPAIGGDSKALLSQTYCGSAAYAAPEILQGIPYNPFMYDVWALGCILYIMVCARMPFDDRDTRKMLKVQLSKRIPYPQSVQLTRNLTELIA